jgi:hypothetical protein
MTNSQKGGRQCAAIEEGEKREVRWSNRAGYGEVGVGFDPSRKESAQDD